MDRSLFGRAVELHGLELDRLIKEEQGVNFLDDVDKPTEHVSSATIDEKSTTLKVDPSFKNLATASVKQDDTKSSKDTNVRGQFTRQLHSFIARKADLLFAKLGEEDKEDKGEASFAPERDDDNAEKSDYYAILPPLEQFAEVRPDVCQARLFEILPVGGVVVGQILSTKEFGIFVKLLALCRGGRPRFLEDCEVVALLPAGELRDHVATVDDFQIGDLIRAAVIKVNVEEQKVIISLHAREGSNDKGILGLITESELPVHYRRSVAQLDSRESYQDMLHNTVGFDNPFNVAYLGTKLGLDDTRPLSLMRGLQRSNFPEKEYAEPLRKWQTNRWSMESVAKGVEYFKAGKLLDAIQHLNKALEIHEENVEALVARGALYANKDLISKALQDFGQALKINPNHRNANKYMCQTLIERGKLHEEAGETDKAADCYQTAIDIKPDFLEAELCLKKINTRRKPAKRVASPESISSSSPKSPGITHISVEALRQLVQPEKPVSQSSKSTEKTKKKKKKKDKDRHKSSRSAELEEDQARGSERKSDRKKRKHSRNYDGLSSESPDDASRSPDASRSRSRSLHRSGDKGSREKGKRGRSTSSKKGKKGAGSRSRHSDSYSSNSSSDRSPSSTLGSRSRSQRGSGRKRSKQERQRRDSWSTSHSRGSSSESFQSSRSRSRHRHPSKRKRAKPSSSNRKVVKHRSRYSASRSPSWSSYSDSESSYSSVSRKTSRKRSDSRSLDHSRRRRSRDDRSRERSSKKETKAAGRRKSFTSSPRSRRRNLSQDYSESVSGKTDSGKRQPRIASAELTSDVRGEKGSIRSRSKLDSGDGSQWSSRMQSRDKSPTEEVCSKQSKEVHIGSSTVKGPSMKRGIDAKQSSDVGEASRRSKKTKEKRRTEDRHQEDSKSQYQTSSQIKDMSSDSHHLLISIPGKTKDNVLSKKDQGANFQDTKFQGRRDTVRKSPSLGNYESQHRSGSSSEGSDSDQSYSSYSLSGSRSYSYSSYSSSGSDSDSDEDRSYRQQNTGSKVNKSRMISKQDDKAVKEPRGKSETKTKKERKQMDDGDENSDSDVDTGIYEISRDHLEMYMDSKSYQMKKPDDNAPLSSRKRWRSDDEGEIKRDKRSKLGKKRKRENSDDGKEDELKSVSESTSATATKSNGVSSQRDGSNISSALPPQPAVLPFRNQDVKPVGSAAFSIPSLTPNVPLSQFSESQLGRQQPLASDEGSIQSILPDVDPPHLRAPDMHKAPSQTLEHRASQPLTTNGKNSRQNATERADLNRSSVSKPNSQELNFGHEPGRDLQGGSGSASSDAGAMSELSRQRMFSSEQLTVIDSISKQLAHAQEKPLHSTSGAKSSDPGATQGNQRYREDDDATTATTTSQGLSEVPNASQGHHIGVIMTQRSSSVLEQSAGYQEMALPQSLRKTTPFDNNDARKRRGRWDVQISDRDQDRGLETRLVGKNDSPSDESKPVLISFDYQHGQDFSVTNSQSIDVKLRELREGEASASVRFGGAAYQLESAPSSETLNLENPSTLIRKENPTGDAERHGMLDSGRQSPGKHEHHHREIADIHVPGHRYPHGSRAERIQDDESPDRRTHYYGTRPDHADASSRGVASNLQAAEVQVVDYQHGRRDKRHERNRSMSDQTREDPPEDRHRDDHHRTSYNRRDNHRERRSSHERRSDDRRNYNDRDRHQGNDTHRHRYHRRSGDAHGDRHHSRSRRSEPPVQPKESNLFLQLVSSSKDMQVASLHSEGKWGHNDSPAEAKPSSRSWWL